ncbi:conjugal transfer protein TraG [Clavibacter michiganensis]|uniref:type IV secretory system conjugative DNA transfer family protein n=1 Tax=Clavibacter michiganensis TaxID=28447 RepID=UPI000CE8E070|nr:type IV secretory system conjugative DNA transfer family protein [Clavibacter michiganensis]PPF91324.1 conjugal transfer protein TraG [Clavibacter michiganensis]PPF99366.1 conjugal transfer protein TraG [Clavibacter michiganensis]
MSREANRRSSVAGDEQGWLVALSALVGAGLIGAVLYAGSLVNPAVRALPTRNPFAVLAAFASGNVTPTAGQILLTCGVFLVVAVIAAVIVRAALIQQSMRSRVDYKARYMAQKRDLGKLTEQEAAADAERLGARHAGIGVTLATHLPSRLPLYATWEYVQIWLMGPRAGKTSCVCVPQILETQGPVLATSNKRDIVDLTRGPRSEQGVVWVHDVQGLIGEDADWWWNPLSFVRDMETAEKLTGIFQSSAESAEAKQDAYFSAAGRETLARLFLAAALGGRPITDVFKWANNPDDKLDDPARILIDAGEAAQGRALGQTQTLTEKQRDGVYGTIRPWIGLLGNRKVLPWITDTGQNRPHFDPWKFVTSTDTIYLISMEGGGNARAITGALAMAVLEAAERTGSLNAGGRLPTPLMAVLDEAANVVRWRELPDKYSHYGSRGIILSTFFQSWQQGVEAYGDTGMGKLWSAANVRVVGSGLAEDKYLPFISQAIGDFDAVKKSRSSQSKSSSTTTSLQRERIFDVSDLVSLPAGRAVMMATQTPAALLKLDHFSARPYAEKVTQSQTYYEARAVQRGAQRMTEIGK